MFDAVEISIEVSLQELFGGVGSDTIHPVLMAPFWMLESVSAARVVNK